jgi:Tfp pilus assembly protein PilX
MNRSHYPRRLNTHRGAALVIVLAFVVLLTGLAVAFLSRAATDRQVSYSSASQSNAELLARGALAITIGDLKQEIAAGSTQTTVSSVTVYSPKPSPSPSTLIPYLAGSTGTSGLENLVKRSANGVSFYPSGSSYNTGTYPAANRAAGPSTSSSTSVASLNGRSVSAARWNKPLLIAKNVLTSTDPTPVSAFTPPDWILVARDGSNPPSWNASMITSPSNTTSVIGRYAYTIYDEGGLIDMNVAGYPTVSTPAQVGRKGTLAYADLTQIPGISSLTTGATGSQAKFLNDIPGWRNFSSGSATGSLGTFSSGNSYSFASGTGYNNAIVLTRNGFMAVSNTSLNNGQSDRKFGSRQELIAFLTRAMASTTSDVANLQTALEYFGTFSRELNRPSWIPYKPTGSTIDYVTLAKTPSPESSTAINRDLTAVRDSSGNQFVKTRFPLSRIDELLDTTNASIQGDFGLKWNAGQNHWDYVGATGSTVQSSIERLDQVAPENRQPNFFEIIKAVILSGSVGLGSSGGTTFVAAEAKYSNADYQIMQIGANIIDAWDSDNIPTFINFGSPAVELAGVENLPYLSKLVYAPIMTNHGHGDEFSAWLVPSFWNPHQNASLAPATPNVRFAMTAGSTTAFLVDNKGTSYQSPAVTGSVANPPSFVVPANLFQVPAPPGPTNVISTANVGTPAATDGNAQYEGLLYCYQVPSPNGITRKSADHAYPAFAGGATFQMQVNLGSPSNPNWKAYQTWTGCTNPTPLTCNSVPNAHGGWQNTSGFLDPEFVALDPRTVRFGIWGSDANDTGNNNDYSTGPEVTMDENNGGSTPELVFSLLPQGASFVTTDTKKKAYLYSSNVVNGVDYYKDLDGVARHGDFTTDANGNANAKTIMYASALPAPTPPNSQDRPQILSAPFQSVTELGQVFRDQPWKTLNFTSANAGATSLSADAGLLDAFTLQDSTVVAGKTSLNTRQTAVLTAILSQATANLTGTTALTPAQRDAVVTALKNLTLTPPAGQPMLINKGELVTRLASDASVTSLGTKEARESVIRALSDSTQTRTWNLMIDVIAQSGRYPSTATNLSQFVVEGEKRYWLHIAIDRFTGEIIDQQLEAVYE